MGNTTNPDKWDAKQRLEFIEQAAFWRGWLQRADLVGEFGISLPQASADLQAYLEQNPDSLEYDLNAKRYVASSDMRLKFTSGNLDHAIGRFLGARSKDRLPTDRVALIDLPYRATPLPIAKDVFRAVAGKLGIEVNYLSVNSNTEGWRWISPHAFAHDGYRWHVRAYCHRDHSYKDFVLGRMSKTKPPLEYTQPSKEDADWNTWETIRLKAHSKLSEIQRRAVELDFDMKQGGVALRVRRSMMNYTLAYLRLTQGIDFPRLLERES